MGKMLVLSIILEISTMNRKSVHFYQGKRLVLSIILEICTMSRKKSVKFYSAIPYKGFWTIFSCFIIKLKFKFTLM